MKLSIVIPAHNEQNRIGRTLSAYLDFFNNSSIVPYLQTEFIVVLNGCTDGTQDVVESYMQTYANIVLVITQDAGKGLAVKRGFEVAVTHACDFIGFVDADMATAPQAFYDLYDNIGQYDGIIASRYMPGAQLYPPRPWIKRWGSKIVYELLVRYLFGLTFYDLQCGAKLFRCSVIRKIVPHLTVRQWAFDVELLYLTLFFGFTVKEHPTAWTDQAESKLRLRSGIEMIGALIKLSWRVRALSNKTGS